MTSNPLIRPWPGPYGGVPPWDQVRADVFPEAFDVALAEHRAEVAAICANREPPTFENTIVALERSGWTRDRVERLFSVLRENVTTPAVQAVEEEWLPRLAGASDEILFNQQLFSRIEAVHASLDSLGDVDRRLTRLVYDRFVRHGARLGADAKRRLSEVNQELASLYAEFRQKVLADENDWTLLETDADCAGLPDALVDALGAAALERGLAARGAVINTRSLVDPFLTNAHQRALRERVWRKFKQRGDNGDANDTKATIARVVALRAERASLLGYASHADWQMADTMAGQPAAARDLLMRVWPPAVARVREEVADMTDIAEREGAPLPLEPWDYLYYADKVRRARYDFDQDDLTPYFDLDNMVAAALWSAERLYKLAFREITGTVPVFHPDVRVWEVVDVVDGAHRGLFYLDNFARAGKKSGAWAVSYREQHRLGGGVSPIVSNNNNFVKPATGEPALVSVDDVRTLFHEFGHALHALLQNVAYPTLAATPNDFVEFPSQLHEYWMLTRELLDGFARHHATGASLPQAMVEKLERSRHFNQGYATVEYLAAAILDMELHTRPVPPDDLARFEREALAAIGMPREVALRHRLPQFDHLFGSDAYAAGYYSYMWAEVLAADTWQAFQDAGGPWDQTLSARLAGTVLSDGNSSDRAEAYRAALGHDPDVVALFARRGLPVR